MTLPKNKSSSRLASHSLSSPFLLISSNYSNLLSLSLTESCDHLSFCSTLYIPFDILSLPPTSWFYRPLRLCTTHQKKKKKNKAICVGTANCVPLLMFLLRQLRVSPRPTSTPSPPRTCGQLASTGEPEQHASCFLAACTVMGRGA